MNGCAQDNDFFSIKQTARTFHIVYVYETKTRVFAPVQLPKDVDFYNY
jgi:hypothetical protein